MLLKLIKRFSGSLTSLHRRTKSDSSAMDVLPYHAPLVTSRSLGDVVEPALDNHVPITAEIPSRVPHQEQEPTVIVGTPSTPTVTNIPTLTSTPSPLSDELMTPVSPLPPRSKYTPKLLAIQERIRTLESENLALKETNAKVIFDAQITSEELLNFKSDYYASLGKDVTNRRRAKSDAESLKKMEEKLTDYERFIDRMIDLGLHEPVLDKARASLRAGEDVDETLVEAIKRAATKKNSPWAKIIPAVTGPRTPDHYLSGLNMILKLRKQLRQGEKKKQFWKTTAQELSPIEILTPSSSDVSSIQEALSEENMHQEKMSAVDDLMERLKRGEIPARRAPPTPEPVSVPVMASTTPLIDTAVVLPVSESVDVFVDVIDPYVPRLATLASVSFKEELNSVHSGRRFSQSRPVLDTIDINSSTSPMSVSASKTSAKALGKRRAITITESIDSITASFTSTTKRRSPPVQAVTASLFSVAENDDAEIPSHDLAVTPPSRELEGISTERSFTFSLCNIISSAPGTPLISDKLFRAPLLDFSASISVERLQRQYGPDYDEVAGLAASQALLSLERICAGLGSYGSLGSLEDSPKKQRTIEPTERITSTFSVTGAASIGATATLLVDRRDEQGTESDFSFAAESLPSEASVNVPSVTPPLVSPTVSPTKASKLPIFSKHTRRFSFRADPAPSATKSTFSSSLKNKSPVRRLATTAPLAIKKVSANVPAPAVSPPKPTRIPSPKKFARVPTSAKENASINSRFMKQGRRAVKTLSRIIS